MQLRCYRCSWSFAVSRDELAFALQSVQESGGNHYDVRCPRCRHANRISLEQLRRSAPKPQAPSETEGEQEGS